MSMSRKLFSVVIFLIAIAVVIGVVSIVGIGRINTSSDQMGRLAARSVSLVSMERISQQRGMATLRNIINTDPAVIQRILQEQFVPTETAMTENLATFQANFPANPPPDMRQQPVEMKKRWDAYVAATAKVSELSQINSNTQANAMVASMGSYWDGLNNALGELIPQAIAATDPKVREWGVKLAAGRVDLVYARMASVEAIFADGAEATGKYVGASQRRAGLFANILKEGFALPAPFGDKAREFSAGLEKTGLPGLTEVLRLAAVDSNAQALTMYREQGDPAFTALNAYAEELASAAIAQSRDVLLATRNLGNQVNFIVILVAVIGIVLAGILAYVIVSGIARQLNRIIQGLDESSLQVASASGAISGSSQHLAEGATEQAASLEETSSALEEMASMTRQNADNATKTNNTTAHTMELITDGAKAVSNMSQAMGEINDSAEQISRIIKTIEEIAFQTNLLALNAAVEAARAGEAGKGFAVVADEVRNLAQRSAAAARDTAQLIEGTVARVRNGTEIASELDTSFKEIDEGAQGVGKLVAEISSATSEQAQGVDQVNTAVAQMDKVTQSNAADAEECASAAEELSAQADTLKGMVDDLVALVSGHRRQGSASAAQRPRQRPAAAKSLPAPQRSSRPAAAPAAAQLSGPAAESKTVMRPNDVIPLDDDF